MVSAEAAPTHSHGARTAWFLGGVALLITAWMVLLWTSWLVTLPWALLFVAGATAIGSARADRRAVLAAAGTTVLACLVRVRLEPVPANWYVDYVHADSYLRRPGGIGQLLEALWQIVPPSSTAVFGLHLAAGVGGIALLTLAGLRDASDPRKVSFTPEVALLWGGFLALDPLIARVAMTDAPHNMGLLALGVAAACYVESRRRPHLLWPVGVLLGSVLVGQSRIELLHMPLWLPLLFEPRHRDDEGPWSRPEVAATVLGIAVAAMVHLARLHLASDLAFPSLSHGLAWLGARTAYATAGWVNGGVLLLLLPLAAWGLWQRQPRALAIALSPWLLSVAGLVSDVGRAPWAHNPAVARYELVIYAAMGLGAAHGVLVLQRACRAASLGPTTRRLVSYGVAGLLLWAGRPSPTAPDALTEIFPDLGPAIQRPLPKMSPDQRMPFQAEYLFLAEALHHLPPGATVLVPWQPHNGSASFNVSLAIPHLLLQVDRTDVRWVAVGERCDVTARPGDYLFRNSLLDISEPGLVALGQERGIESLRALRRCYERLARGGVVIDRHRGPMRSFQVPLQHPEGELVLSRLDP